MAVRRGSTVIYMSFTYGPGGREVSTPLYGLYRYVRPLRFWFNERLWSDYTLTILVWNRVFHTGLTLIILTHCLSDVGIVKFAALLQMFTQTSGNVKQFIFLVNDLLSFFVTQCLS